MVEDDHFAAAGKVRPHRHKTQFNLFSTEKIDEGILITFLSLMVTMLYSANRNISPAGTLQPSRRFPLKSVNAKGACKTCALKETYIVQQYVPRPSPGCN